MSGFSELDAMIARLNSLSTLTTDAAPEVAHAFEQELQGQIAAATGPDGSAWAPKKDGTGRPLATAGKALAVVAIGSTVFARLTGHIARHNNGRARGGVTRQILPTKEIPAPVVRAIKRVLAENFQERMGGGNA